MSVVGGFTVSADAFALARTFSSAPSVSVEFDRLVAHSSDWMMPFLWVTGTDFDAVESELRADPTVREATATDEFDDGRLYEVTWGDEVKRTVNTILDHRGTLLAATGHDGEWYLRVRFADRSLLQTFQEHFRERGGFTLQHLSTPNQPHSDEFGLTGKQREALLAAFEAGYFERPRATTASELAAEFELSQQAFSERMRRGLESLVENTLVTGDRSRFE